MPCSGLVLWLGASLTGGFFRALFWLGSLAGGVFRVLFRFSCSSLERENLHLLAAGNGYVPSRDRWSRPKKGNSSRASMRRASKLRTRNTLRTGGGSTHITAQNFASPHGRRHFKELHISAGITHHPNLNPAGDAGFCWSLPETSKLSETSRTPLFSARTPAI